MNELTTTNRQLAASEPSVGALIQSVIDSGITKDSVDVLERMLAMKERVDAKESERQFAAAYINLQKELPTIQGVRPIPDKQGNIKFCYANFDDIDQIVRPICLRNGFAYSFREGGIDNGRVTVIMTLQHEGGFSRDIPYSVRVGGGPPGANESQADVSGHSYAQRGAIESGLSLRIIGKRDDPKMQGTTITPEQSAELKRRVDACKLREPAQFLEFAGATSYETIMTSRFDELDAWLIKAETTRGLRKKDGTFAF